MKKVLYIEDEPFLGKIVHETLLRQGFDVTLVADGAKALQAFGSFAPDICVLDIMLPNVDGYTLCERIKGRFPNLPVIFLTAKTETEDLVKGFEAGGTDYMRKPFSMEELIVRINNQLSLLGSRQESTERTLEKEIGLYRYYPVRYELVSPARTIRLSQREHDVLQLLVASVNKPVSRKGILQTVWGDDSFFNSRTLDVYIRKLRGYLSDDPRIEIVTLKGKGYLFLVRS